MKPKAETKLSEISLLVLKSPLQKKVSNLLYILDETKGLRGILKIAQYDNYEKQRK